MEPHASLQWLISEEENIDACFTMNYIVFAKPKIVRQLFYEKKNLTILGDFFVVHLQTDKLPYMFNTEANLFNRLLLMRIYVCAMYKCS